ncbi:maternal B9.15 protein-like [Mantella aurantiaca]
MHREINAAVQFLVAFFSHGSTLKPDQLKSLEKNLVCLLSDRYRGHWYPDQPARGQAYRCIRINSWQYVDETLLQACTLSGIEYSELPLPVEITLWIDPLEVSLRIGEDMEILTIVKYLAFDREVLLDVAAVAFDNEVLLDDIDKPVPATSDYSSESVSESSSDETSEDPDKAEDKAVLHTSPSPDEAFESPRTSNSGTPVSELLALDQETDDTDESVFQENETSQAWEASVSQ